MISAYIAGGLYKACLSMNCNEVQKHSFGKDVNATVRRGTERKIGAGINASPAVLSVSHSLSLALSTRLTPAVAHFPSAAPGGQWWCFRRRARRGNRAGWVCFRKTINWRFLRTTNLFAG